jgi:multiple sugar transport system permease protein
MSSAGVGSAAARPRLPKRLVLPSRGLHSGEARIGAVMALIAIAPIVVFLVIPMFGSFWLSLTDFNLFLTDIDFVGLRNYQDALADPLFYTALRNTIQYTLEAVPLTVGLAFLVAVFVNKPIRGIAVFRTAYYLPTISSLVAVGVVWTAMFDPRSGIMTAILGFLGLPSNNWLRDPSLAMHALVLVTVWKGFGLAMIVYLAGLQGIPREFYEAAEMDGAGRIALIRHITLPLVRPVTFYLVITGAIATFQAFDLIAVMTEGGPLDRTTTMVHQVYLNAFVFNRMGYASALAFVLFVLILIVTIINVRLLSDKVEY